MPLQGSFFSFTFFPSEQRSLSFSRSQLGTWFIAHWIANWLSSTFFSSLSFSLSSIIQSWSQWREREELELTECQLMESTAQQCVCLLRDYGRRGSNRGWRSISRFRNGIFSRSRDEHIFTLLLLAFIFENENVWTGDLHHCAAGSLLALLIKWHIFSLLFMAWKLKPQTESRKCSTWAG